MIQKKRVAILISGRGSNMQALVNAAKAKDYPAEIVRVISNRPDAAGLEWAKSQGVPALAIDHKAFTTRALFEGALQAELTSANVEFIALAGFMRLMTRDFVESWRDRMINIHPSLLPSFKGLHTHEQALAAGVKIAGCTVHFVRAEMDTGPIIGQAAVAVRSDDTPATLAARVLRAEHAIYPISLARVASGSIFCRGEKIVTDESVTDALPLYSPPN